MVAQFNVDSTALPESALAQSPCRTFTAYNKLVSLRARIDVSDSSGAQIASAQRRLLSWRTTWDIEVGERRIRLRRKLLTLLPQWLVDGDLGEFSIHRRWALFRRRYRISGGPFHGVALVGNFTDLRLEATLAGRLLLKTRGFILTLRDRHEVEVYETSQAGTLFGITTLVALLADRRDDRERERLRDET